MTTPQVKRLARLTLDVRELDRSRRFYTEALGFTPARTVEAGRAVLKLGAQEIVLVQASPDAPPYPAPRAADDPWFQHFAIAVADMAAAYSRLLPHVGESISRGGPVLLPPSTGSVTAYKFRDPDGHPLELSFSPASAWARAAAAGSPLFQGVDHTALAVRDLEASVAFYTGLGLRCGPRLLNRGPEQDRLDGLNQVELDIAVLSTPDPGPHFELLHYRRPEPRRSGRPPSAALCSICTELICSGLEPGEVRRLEDPDGHRLHLHGHGAVRDGVHSGSTA